MEMDSHIEHLLLLVFSLFFSFLFITEIEPNFYRAWLRAACFDDGVCIAMGTFAIEPAALERI